MLEQSNRVTMMGGGVYRGRVGRAERCVFYSLLVRPDPIVLRASLFESL